MTKPKPKPIAPPAPEFEVIEEGEDEEGPFQTVEFTIPVPASAPTEQWSDEELFKVRGMGPAIIGQAMFEAKERRIKHTGDGKLGPAITTSAADHDAAVAAHALKLAERAKMTEARIAAEKVARKDRYEAALHSPYPTKPAA